MMTLRRIAFSLCMLLTGLVLAGCPHHIEGLIEDAIPPEGYKPVYLTSQIPFDSLIRAYGGTLGTSGSASTGSSVAIGADGDTTSTGPLTFELLSVNDAKYPREIELRAYVYDTSGRFVTGLAPPDFRGNGTWRNYWRSVIDSCGGTATVIDSFEVTEVREEVREPYALAIVLDHSGSMGEFRVQRLREVIAQMLRAIRKEDNVAVLAFTDRTFVEVPLTASKKKWVTSFNEKDLSSYGGGTALYDGALAGIEQVTRSAEGHNRAVILFTDGIDGDSDSTVAAVHKAARKNRVALYTIAYGLADEATLQDLAQYSGGRMYRLYSTKEFPFVFNDIYRRLNNYYRVTYRPPECVGVHTATSVLSIPEFGYDRLRASGVYDRSLITPFAERGEIVFLNIEFDYNEATIKPESLPQLASIADAMNRYPDMNIEVRGHTDDQGSEEYNLDLSQRRAEAVADALVGMGIGRSRLFVKGYGESRPIAPNDTDANRRRNRRTEFVVLK